LDYFLGEFMKHATRNSQVIYRYLNPQVVGREFLNIELQAALSRLKLAPIGWRRKNRSFIALTLFTEILQVQPANLEVTAISPGFLLFGDGLPSWRATHHKKTYPKYLS
jgi:hypothetical protein